MDVAIIIAVIIILFLSVEKIRKAMLPLDATPEVLPVVYPLEPMMDNYADIIVCIMNAPNIKNLNAIYIRIIIFQGCYSDSKLFQAELMVLFKEKEEELNGIKM